ncbi:MAG: Asp-tRNA(Asn)/Glu-tRNA(Gln) amidotransferase subunit GatB [Chloroflexi bacterium]|nr:Asp-tRNA(Asn)/Glu-tRNA(Gln) amidotransferase subunit GatB [Chloroflexota bacterium]
MAKDYEIVIGMEAHAQLLTKSKMFCGCSAAYAQAPPNSLVCPICLGLPGSLPVVNQKALQQTIMVGLALGCKIRIDPQQIKWDRKNYHYPDLPKGYQISQYDLPIAYGGEIKIALGGEERRIRIRRVHLEEDTAKLLHADRATLIDFNRSGVPLIEVVTEPDIRSPQEAKAYVEKLRQILRYLGVSSGNMEEGSLRLEANISLRPAGSAELGTRTEIKNLNSFRAVEKALAYEVERQRKILEAGGKIQQQTMGWDEAKGVTVLQRTKEYAQDYRYFPEPDLPPLLLNKEWVEEIKSHLPELPEALKRRFIKEYGLTAYDAEILTQEPEVAEAFEEYVAAYPQNPKAVGDRIARSIFPVLKESEDSLAEIKRRLPPWVLGGIIAAKEQGKVTTSTADELAARSARGEIAAADVKALEAVFAQYQRIGTSDSLLPVIEKVLAENPKPVADYLKGKDTVLRFFIGQVAKETKGQADPNLVKELLVRKLEDIRQGGTNQ